MVGLKQGRRLLRISNKLPLVLHSFHNSSCGTRKKSENQFHWFTLFYANLNGLDSQVEILKDNIKWSVGEKMLTSLAWKRSNHYYAVRQFVILKKI